MCKYHEMVWSFIIWFEYWASLFTSPFFLGGYNDDHVPTLAPASSSHCKSRTNKHGLHLLPTSLKPWTSQQPGIEVWGVIGYHCSSSSTLALFEQWNEPLSQDGLVKLTQLVCLYNTLSLFNLSLALGYIDVLWYIPADESAVMWTCHVVNARDWKCPTPINVL